MSCRWDVQQHLLPAFPRSVSPTSAGVGPFPSTSKVFGSCLLRRPSAQAEHQLAPRHLKAEGNSADFIYSEYLTSVGARFRKLVWQIAEDYAKADLLLRLPGYCPMPAFREVIDVPLVARKAQKTPAQV